MEEVRVTVCVSRPGQTHNTHPQPPRAQWRRKLRGGSAARHPLAPRWPKLKPQVRDRRPRRLTPLLPALNHHPARVCAAPEAGRASAAPGRGRSGRVAPGRTPPQAGPWQARRGPGAPQDRGTACQPQAGTMQGRGRSPASAVCGGKHRVRVRGRARARLAPEALRGCLCHRRAEVAQAGRELSKRAHPQPVHHILPLETLKHRPALDVQDGREEARVQARVCLLKRNKRRVSSA